MKKITVFIFLFVSFLLVGCTKSYSVTFVTNNDQQFDAISVEEGQFIELPALTKEGYDFKGWYVDEEFTSSFKVKDPIISDITLYAKWDIKLFSVIFKDYDDTIIVTREGVPYKTAANAPEDPIREGYDFTGWDIDFSDVRGHLNVTAIYTIKSYDVQFYDEENEPLGDLQTVEHGSSAVAPDEPTKVGYEFTGWDQSFLEVTSDLQIRPLFERLEYSVEFQDSNGNRIGEVQTVYYGEGATAPANPTKNGYTFDRWDQEFANITANLIVKAVYLIDEYEISYFDGTNELVFLPDLYTIESRFDLQEYEKTGYLFIGWFEEATFINQVNSIIPGETGDITLYGKWLDESLTYDINYELNGGGWTWTTETVADPANGIDAYSNLPEQLMADFYVYLKTNDLLSSVLVATKLHKTTWDTFKANYTDPVAIYNHTSTNTSQANDGYSQFFYTSATGNTTNHVPTTITGGFFGTEPYKTKYANLLPHLSVMLFLKGYNTEFWNGGSSKTLAGFVLDGYFYGTQGAGTGDFALLRSRIPNTNLRLNLASGSLTEQTTNYQTTSYIQGLSAQLVAPIKDGSVFAGWYDNTSFTGEPIWDIKADVAPASMYYAKWIAYSELE